MKNNYLLIVIFIIFFLGVNVTEFLLRISLSIYLQHR